MSARMHKSRLLHRCRRDESGAALVEFAIVMALFLLIFFALIDFGRLASDAVLAQKATHNAVRIAVVRPPACPGVPTVNQRVEGSDSRFGTLCRDAAAPCVMSGPFVCTLEEEQELPSPSLATRDEIWGRIRPLLPGNAEREDVQLTYRTDPELGFVGGPYVPIVTVELVGLDFEFITPLAGLAGLAGAANASDLGASFTFPSMQASMPGEDLAHGGGG